MKRFLGQHFLKNQSAVRAILKALNLKKGDTVIEIGPGGGALTKELLALCQKHSCELIAVEKDRRLAQALYSELKNETSFTLLASDILKELNPLSEKIDGEYHIVGNIPYYISGKLLRLISELKNKPKSSILMLQKELAERICAPTGKMSLLSSVVQFWSKPSLIYQLKKEDFDPAPKVDSSVVFFEHKKHNLKEAKAYYSFLRAIFKQPRKTLLNNLKEAGFELDLAKTILEKEKLAQTIRSHQLSQEKIQGLAQAFSLETPQLKKSKV